MEVIDGTNCATITFECNGNLTCIPDTNLGFTTVVFPGWLTLTNHHGNFSNEPSPIAIAFWLEEKDFPDTSRNITFTNAVSSIELFYTSFVPISINAYDEDNNLIKSVTGPANSNDCFNTWDPLSVIASQNIIKRIKITGNACETGIDNLTVCTTARGLVAE
ncbi:hypothetical protein [Clostridium peptidivorans]|uniref:hypothetical protein n=1 Tax=Clostridium peptidivorans TaxID=100174 RepID=UPI000BE3EFC6|nr:hypothetical protein [Clostridium peptidivorans]